MFTIIGLSFRVDKFDVRCVDAFILSIVFGLGGDVVVEIGENNVFVIYFVNDFSSFFDSFNDEVDLFRQIFYLSYLDVDEVVFEHFFASIRVGLDLFLELN